MVLSSIRKINLQLFVTNLHVLSLTDFAVKPELKAGSFNTSFNDQMTVFFFFWNATLDRTNMFTV